MSTIARAPEVKAVPSAPEPVSWTGDHVRLMIRDPETLFVYWRVTGRTRSALVRELGERMAELSVITLRVWDPESGEERRLFQRNGRRHSYLDVEPSWLACRVELGLTLPSGEFRALAASEAVRPARRGPSASPAEQTVVVGEQRQRFAAPAPAPRRTRTRAARVGPAVGGASEQRPGGASELVRG